tara:strand:- start:248 stop:1069 length:822 start_codon:yes stop_codon:yes gene_type:complete
MYILVKRISQVFKIIYNYFKHTCFYSIFLIKPLNKKEWNKYDYTSSHFHKGKDYHDRFENLPGRKIIWKIEKKIIDIFLEKLDNLDHLDFAGGTGRITEYLQNKSKKQYLIDSSTKMISHAKKILNNVNFINEDFKKISKIDKQFDLVTAFRFFPNAEPHLREAAMKFISINMKEGGYLIINNHKNFWSLPFILKRLTFRSDGFGMTHTEIKSIVEKYNLKIIDYYSCGVIFEAEKSKLIPWKLFENLELILHKYLRKSKLGFNTLYLIRKND